MENVDKRFALIAKDGDILFPYQKRQRATNRFGFALSAPGEGDRHGGGEYTEDLGEVIRRVVFDRWKVRVTTVDKTNKQRQGSLGLEKSAIKSYWVAPEFEHLVGGAAITPVNELPQK
jgi:hypothetical protein